MSTKETIYDIGPEDVPKDGDYIEPVVEAPVGMDKKTPNGQSDPAGKGAVDPTRETIGGSEAE